ncbi:hypothetical protein NEOLEDRAFT_1126184 [Neolentinus lepideus HHB14362 ss-1]|uniref:Inner centromere protein ARK-binding domain-containing protein n=1 Tax=Neolentinus lepideus HHB14362 ss-1 TaxID=1314782 RepID=A0A165W2W9_9AGAM|nr:hypothetical protein NEOLEDRAFT_1126184 [Neolentinus lepideus HHB14362 ss-1]
MADTQSGILTWATSIRTALASDPAMQAFGDQIQQHGLLFLDNYMENILTGPNREPIIELVKTPSRKKDAPKRTRAATAATAKAQSIIFQGAEDQDSKNDNLAPFQRALVKAREDPLGDDDARSFPSSQFFHQVLPLNSHPPSFALKASYEGLEIVDVVDSVPPTPAHENDGVIIYDVDSSPLRPIAESPLRVPVLENHLAVFPEPLKELSIIAEDDEVGERSRQPSLSGENRTSNVHLAPPATQTGSSDVLESAVPSASEEVNVPTSDRPLFNSTPVALDLTQNPDLITVSHPSDRAPSSDGDAQSTAIPVPLDDVIMVPLKDTKTSPKMLNRKASIPMFPSLPAPSPLRKSMRAPREPSVGTSLHSTVSTPAAVGGVGGKRTSWLVKAREAKAIEVPAKRAQTPKQTTSSQTMLREASGGLKRKSDEMLHPSPWNADAHARMEEDERRSKVAKLSQDVEVKDTQHHETHGSRPGSPHTTDAPPEDDFARLKRTVQEFGRTGKSLGGKSLGGPAAAAALAEARKAAEAKVAERNKVQNPAVPSESIEHVVEDVERAPPVNPPAELSSAGASDAKGRLSMSDLVGDDKQMESIKETSSVPSGPAGTSSPVPPLSRGVISDSTTPPNSPPPQLTVNEADPVVSNASLRPVVFVPPPTRPMDIRPGIKTFAAETQSSFKSMASNPFSAPSVFSLPSKLQPMQSDKTGLSAQSSAASLFSDAVFDSQPSWIPSQETNATEITSQSSRSLQEDPNPVFDEDDEAERYERDFAKANPTWTPFGFANPDESVTWTTDPTESHKGDTGPIDGHETSEHVAHMSDPEDGFDEVGDQPIISDQEGDGDMDSDQEEEALPDADHALVLSKLSERLNESKSTSGKSTGRSESQISMASSGTSTSQMGFFGHAARLVSNALGSGKKKVEPVKSLQLAAAAAKKQQEEQERKTARLKEMETRRQQASQRKAEEEKARVLEEERKAKDDAERRKRERDEHTDKRPLKINGKKIDDDAANKKRKVNMDADNKVEVKKPPSKDKKDPLPPRVPPATLRPSQSKTNLKAIATPKHPTAVAGPSNLKALTSAQSKTSILIKDKGKARSQDENVADGVPSKTLVRTPGQMHPPRQPTTQSAKPPVPSESIELPDINSEYSDSDDEGRKRNFDPPHWAQSPNLRQALEQQSTVNPDHIFGAVRPLHMEEIFRTRQSRFRARTSSANWTGVDRLTIEEQLNYARRMGYE